MNHYTNYDTFEFNSQNAIQDDPDVFSSSSSNIDLYHLIESIENRTVNQNVSYAILAFDIDNYIELIKLYGDFASNELMAQVHKTLQNHIKQPHMYNGCVDKFVILLENYKSIDVALLVIELSEEIYSFCPDIKLSFGICIAGPSDRDISTLYKRARLAKNSIKGLNQPILANYSNLVIRKDKSRFLRL